MVLVSLTIGHPCSKEKVNENLVCLIRPNITIKEKYKKNASLEGGKA